MPELGFGSRLRWISKDMTQATSTLDLTGGPTASAALGIRILPGLTWDISVEGGYDLRGYGPWFVPRLGLTVHYRGLAGSQTSNGSASIACSRTCLGDRT